ncbi:flagellar export chaperone FliS [Vibrio astriarenae]
MLLGKQAHESYATVQVNANASVSSSFELIYMLHDRLSQELETLGFAIEKQDYELKARSSQKAIDILIGLDSALDTESEEELVQRIHTLYEHGVATIFQASKELDAEAINTLNSVMEDLKQGWSAVLGWTKSE